MARLLAEADAGERGQGGGCEPAGD
jgi:hypothetical protein